MIKHDLKFALTASMAAEFEQRAAIGLTQPSSRHWSRYYDTDADDLLKASLVLRVRSAPEGYLQSLQSLDVLHSPGSAHSLESGEPGGAPQDPGNTPQEWAHPVPEERLELEALPPPSHAAGALTRECFPLLAPLFDCDFERQVRLVRPQSGLRVEIACDRGEIRAGRRSEPIAEVRLERKDGSLAAFYHYAMQWARLHHAQLLLGSKHLRGTLLAGRQAQAPVAFQSPPCAPRPDLPVAAAARQILAGHLQHIRGNIVPVLGQRSPEGVQQLRDALRRFRAAIRFLDLRRPAPGSAGLPTHADIPATWNDLDRRAQVLATAVSLVSDVDALEAGPLARLKQKLPDDPALQVLDRSLYLERERQRQRLRALLESPRLAAFLIEAQAAAESLPADRWHESSFEDFGAMRLERLARRTRRRVRHAVAREDWHAVGLAIRNLRYALDGCRLLKMSIRLPVAVNSALAQWETQLGTDQTLARAPAITGRALRHTAAPAGVALRAAALVDGYAAFAVQLTPDFRLPLLATLRQLRAPNRATAPGYHPETPAATVPDTWSDGFDNGLYEEETR
jgi:triphosphatase